MTSQTLDQAYLDKLFPPERADAFFDALFGGAEDGAYDIRLVCKEFSPTSVTLAFELHQRPGKCLACNLTYGLPQVFERHPVINVKGIVGDIAATLGWNVSALRLRMNPTQEITPELHIIPLTMEIT